MFRSEFFFRTTQELEYLFFLSRKARIFFPDFNIRLYDKNSESDYYFFPPPKSEIFFSATLGIRIFFLEKNHNPPFKLNGRSLTCILCKIMEHIIASNLMKHLESNNILYDLQHGFRSSISCEIQLISFMSQCFWASLMWCGH